MAHCVRRDTGGQTASAEPAVASLAQTPEQRSVTQWSVPPGAAFVEYVTEHDPAVCRTEYIPVVGRTERVPRWPFFGCVSVDSDAGFITSLTCNRYTYIWMLTLLETEMVPAKFAILLGVGLLSFLFVVALYVVWTRIVGLDPTVAQWCADLSRPVRTLIALVSGAGLATTIMAAPTVEVGIAGIVLLAASAFAALMVFEMLRHRPQSAT